MPTYAHHCRECDEFVDEFRRVADFDLAPPCPKCGEPMPQRFSNISVRGNYTGKRPHLESMGMTAPTAAEIAEHHRRWPDVDLVMKEGTAVPVPQSLSAKRRFLRENDMVDMKDFC